MTNHSGQPLELTVNPSGVKIPEGFGTYHGAVTFTNDGHQAITVTPELIKFTGAHACTGKTSAPTWITVGKSARFKIGPAHSHTLSYTVHATHGVTGSAAVAGEAAGPRTSAGQIGGAVGTRVTVGSGAQTCVKAVAVPLHVASSPPWGVIGLAAGLALLLVLLVVLVRRARHHA